MESIPSLETTNSTIANYYLEMGILSSKDRFDRYTRRYLKSVSIAATA